MSNWRFALLALPLILGDVGFAQDPSRQLLDEIIAEATRANQGPGGRPLPLAAHWNGSGARRAGFSPEYQLQLLRQGRHILPWLEWPPTAESLEHAFQADKPRRQKYIDDRLREYEPILKEFARLRLPLSLLAVQWESGLSLEPAFFNLPPEANPNVIDLDGKVQPQSLPVRPGGTVATNRPQLDRQ